MRSGAIRSSLRPLRRAYERLAAATVAAAYAFGTAMWSTASQALRQHGPLNAFVLAYAGRRSRAKARKRPVS